MYATSVQAPGRPTVRCFPAAFYLGDVLLARRGLPGPIRAALSTALDDYVRLADLAGEAAARNGAGVGLLSGWR